MLNEFSLLITYPPPHPALFLKIDNIYQAGWMEYQTKSNDKYTLFILYIKFQNLKVLFIKVFKVNFYISQMNFIQNNLKKGIFVTDFPFSNGFTALKLPLPPSLMAQEKNSKHD